MSKPPAVKIGRVDPKPQSCSFSDHGTLTQGNYGRGAVDLITAFVTVGDEMKRKQNHDGGTLVNISQLWVDVLINAFCSFYSKVEIVSLQTAIAAAVFRTFGKLR